MKIRLKDRIRLNNAIWRCWHIECEYFLSVWKAHCMHLILRKFIFNSKITLGLAQYALFWTDHGRLREHSPRKHTVKLDLEHTHKRIMHNEFKFKFHGQNTAYWAKPALGTTSWIFTWMQKFENSYLYLIYKYSKNK